MSDSLLRKAEHKFLASIELHGKVLDIGGDRRSEYLKLLKGTYDLTVLNLNPDAQPDILHDVERPLPVADASFEAALIINLLEHTYNHRQLLTEAARVVKPGGTVVIVVPFLFPIHPSPNDYFRYTEQALRLLCEEAGLTIERLESLGGGVWSVRHLMINRLLPGLFQGIDSAVCGRWAQLMDSLTARLAKSSGKDYRPSDYPLGTGVVARKSN